MTYTYCLIFLALLPLASFHVCKSMAKSHIYTITGLALGVVIAPVSQGLVEFTLIPVVGAYIGFVGMIFNMIHGAVGFFFLGALGVFEPDTVLTGSQMILMNMVNAVIWTSYYGFVGRKMDLKLSPQGEEVYVMVARQSLKHS